MDHIDFTEEKARRFQRKYEKAKKEGREAFKFEDKDVLVAYAKYVIEYLKMNGFLR